MLYTTMAPHPPSAVDFVGWTGSNPLWWFSPQVRPCPSPLFDVLAAFRCEDITNVVAPVLQIMPELRMMGGKHALLLLMVHVHSLVASAAVLPPPTTPPSESSHVVVTVECGGLGTVAFHSLESFSQVVPGSDEVVALVHLHLFLRLSLLESFEN